MGFAWIAVIFVAIAGALYLLARRGVRFALPTILSGGVVGLLAMAGIWVGFLGGAWGLVPGLPAVLLFALMALVRLRRGAAASWLLPFAWILIVPAVTVPSHIGLLGVITDNYHHEGVSAGGAAGRCEQVNHQRDFDKLWHCPVQAAVPTLLPGLLNLIPFAGLLSSNRRVRLAGVVAGSLGAARFLAPTLIYLADAPDVEIIGSWQWPPAMGSLASGYTSVGLWFASLLAAIIFASRSARSDSLAGDTGSGSLL